jgi:hypothetical protein
MIFFLLLLAMPMRAVSGRSRSMRAGFSTGIHRHMSSKETYSLLGWISCAWCERKPLSQKLCFTFWSTPFASTCVNLIHCTQTVITTFQLKYHGIICLCVVFAHSRFIENILIWSWEMNPSFWRWFYHSWYQSKIGVKHIIKHLKITKILSVRNA